jgi:hypothetical protein
MAGRPLKARLERTVLGLMMAVVTLVLERGLRRLNQR